MAQTLDGQEHAEQVRQVVARAWQDDAFKQRLLTRPAATLEEQGVSIPAGKAVRVVEDTADTVHLVLPPKPVEGERAAERLAQAAGEGQDPARKLGQVVAKTWQDDAFKQRLVADPRAVLQEHGLPLPAGKAVRVVENTPETVHLVLPPKPVEGELSDEQLEQVSGGLLVEALIGVGAVLLAGMGIEDGPWGDIAGYVGSWFD